MTDEEARAWLRSTFDVSRETFVKIEAFAQLVAEGQKSQNLVSAATLSCFWSRHIVDSAQLLTLSCAGSWLDIGSGAGIPGMVIALLSGDPVTLVEPRARRAEFLRTTTASLGLTNVTVEESTMKALALPAVDVITARAVAALPALLEMSIPFSHADTVLIFPKGKTALVELASLSPSWQGRWDIVDSVTDRDSKILVGRGISMKAKR